MQITQEAREGSLGVKQSQSHAIRAIDPKTHLITQVKASSVMLGQTLMQFEAGLSLVEVT